jgi:phosphohistidine phosphatase
MELLLWRHADAESGAPDLARRLTAKGEKQARRMAQWLHATLPESTRICVSPAIRAQQTAQALIELGSRKLHTIDALAPGASFDDILAAVQWPIGPATLIVGHQPTLGNVASWLMTGTEHDWAIKKGAVWWLSRREDDDTVIRAVISPDLL